MTLVSQQKYYAKRVKTCKFLTPYNGYESYYDNFLKYKYF